MGIAYLLTGSNLGDSNSQLLLAISHITERIGHIIQTSSIYKTAPWGNINQPPFLNQVLVVETHLKPYELMQTILQIEADMGRIRTSKWEPRSIDIDILFYDQLVIEGNLNIPHPLIQERRFVLAPLNELNPNFIHPKLNQSMSELLQNCNDNGLVEKV